MTRVQKLQLKQSELRTAIAGELDKELEQREDGALERMTKEAQALELDLQAALTIEQESLPSDQVDTAEGREIRQLMGLSSIADYVDEAMRGQPVDGASRELREALLGKNHIGYLPLDMLADLEPVELRADAVSSVAAAIQDNQQSIAARVFNRTAATYLGATMPSVGVGDVSYPRLTSGTTADVREEGVELDGGAAVLTTETVTPSRLTASYTFNIESLARVRGFEEALRRDLRGVFADKIDNLLINGQVAVNNVSPAVEGLLSAIAAPDDPTSVSSWKEYFAAFDAMVDGVYAVSDSEVRLLLNADGWRHAMALLISTSNSTDGLLRRELPADRFRVSANMPATASMFSQGLSYAFGAGRLVPYGMLMPVWRGLQLIMDPYTKAKSGEQILTAVQLIGSALVDPAQYGRFAVQVV